MTVVLTAMKIVDFYRFCQEKAVSPRAPERASKYCQNRLNNSFGYIVPVYYAYIPGFIHPCYFYTSIWQRLAVVLRTLHLISSISTILHI